MAKQPYGRRQATQRATPVAAETAVSRYSNLAAQWSQVLMLGLVAFGYFYTVRPVYQKDLLEEDAARLTLETKQLERQNASALSQAHALRHELSDLRVARDQLSNQNKTLASDAVRLRGDATILAQRAKGLTGRLTVMSAMNNAQLQQLTIGQRALLDQQLGLSQPVLDGFKAQRLASALLDGNETGLREWADAEWKQPQEAFVAAIDAELSHGTYFGLPEPHPVSEQVIRELRAQIVAKSDQLSCPALDRQAWVQSYRRTLAQAAADVPLCVDHLTDKQMAEDHIGPARTALARATPYWRRQLTLNRDACEDAGRLHVPLLYWNAWHAYFEPCFARIVYAGRIARGLPAKVPPNGSGDPPALEHDWYISAFSKKQPEMN